MPTGALRSSTSRTAAASCHSQSALARSPTSSVRSRWGITAHSPAAIRRAASTSRGSGAEEYCTAERPVSTSRASPGTAASAGQPTAAATSAGGGARRPRPGPPGAGGLAQPPQDQDRHVVRLSLRGHAVEQAPDDRLHVVAGTESRQDVLEPTRPLVELHQPVAADQQLVPWPQVRLALAERLAQAHADGQGPRR